MTDAVPESPRWTLLSGPAGSGKTTRALETIRRTATTPGDRGRGAAGPGEALLILPTYSQALHLQRVALSRWDARAILDDPFATFTSAGERFLDDFRVRTLPAAEERDRLMDEATRRAAVPIFEAVRSRPGFRARLLRLVKEVKQSGREPAEARERLVAGAPGLAPDARERLDGFLQVFAHYETLLELAGLEDHEDSLRRLLRHVRDGADAVHAPRVLVVDGFDDFTPVEQGILDALADVVVARGGRVIVTLPWDDVRPELFAASAPARRHLLGHGYHEERLPGFPRSEEPALARIATRLFGQRDSIPTPCSSDADSVEVVVAGDPEDEAEAVARRARALWAAGGLPRGWRDLGVIVRRLDETGPRLTAAFERLGIPHRLVGAGRPLAAEGAMRALRGPLAWLAAAEGPDVDAQAMLVWLRWCAFAAGDPDRIRAVDALEVRWRRGGFPRSRSGFLAATLQLPAGVTLQHESAPAAAPGPFEGLEALEAHRQRCQAAHGAAEVHALLETAVLDLLPLPAAGGLDASGRSLDADADRHRLHAVAARDRVVTLLRGLARAAARTGLGAEDDVRIVVAALVDAIEHARLVLPDRRLDAVSILDAEEARFWELPVVFVAGLAQGQFPLHPTEDVVLRDDERETLRSLDGGLALPLARERETRERRLFYGALTRARRLLVLFRPGSSGDGDARSPSLFLRDLERVAALRESVPRPTGRPAPRLEECYTSSDLALFAAARARDRTAGADESELARALLARGDVTLSARAARWRREAADLLSDVPLERFDRSVAVVSATMLGAATACQHRHFLRAVVGIPEDDVPFGGPAFGYRDEGTLLHEALRRAMVEPDLPVSDIASAVLAWASAEGGRDLAPVDEVERARLDAELLRVLTLFRERERETAGDLAPLAGGLELAFGSGAHEAVRLGDGPGAFRLRGQIDRIDTAGRSAVVIDYKRSGGSVGAAAKAFEEGIDLQLPLYASAVERLFDLQVVGFEWVAAARRVRRGRWSEQAAALYGRRQEGTAPKALAHDEWRALLGDVVERASNTVQAVREGEHALQTVDAKRCGRCAYFHVCRTSFVRGRVPESAGDQGRAGAAGAADGAGA